jgi:hypothetical protein
VESIEGRMQVENDKLSEEVAVQANLIEQIRADHVEKVRGLQGLVEEGRRESERLREQLVEVERRMEEMQDLANREELRVKEGEGREKLLHAELAEGVRRAKAKSEEMTTLNAKLEVVGEQLLASQRAHDELEQ